MDVPVVAAETGWLLECAAVVGRRDHGNIPDSTRDNIAVNNTDHSAFIVIKGRPAALARDAIHDTFIDKCVAGAGMGK